MQKALEHTEGTADPYPSCH